MTRRRLSRFLVAAFFAATTVTLVPTPAGACSCALGDPRDAVDAADAAFVGELVAREEPQPRGGIISSGQNVTWTFEVEQVVKGPLGGTVEVVSPWSGASCGLEVGVGRRTGLLLHGSERRWTSSLCLQLPTRVLTRVAEPLLAPNATGPPVFFLGGTMGEARMVALDVTGRTAAYGFGSGYALSVAGCAGGSRIAEVAIQDGKAGGDIPSLVVRDAVSLEPLREVRLPAPAVHVREMVCGDSGGAHVYLYVGAGRRAEILDVRGDTVSTITVGDGRAATFDGDVAYVTVRASSREWRVVRLDLATGVRNPVATVPVGTGAIVPSPDRTRLASVVYSAPLGRSPPPSRVLVVDLRSDPPTIVERDLSRPNVTGDAVWLDADRLAFFPDGDGDTDFVRIYDRNLQEVERIAGWEADDTVVLGGRAFGFGWGTVQTLDLREGSVDVLRRLDGDFYAFAHVPASSVAAGSGPTGTDRTPWLIAAVAALVLAALLLGGRAIRARTA